MKIVLNSRKNQGQVLVLAAFTTLLVAICLFMTISVSWQVRNRIQLQHAADAKAFSDATMVARAYNSLAYSNRAIAGNIVSMTILHAFHSEISAASDIDTVLWMNLVSSVPAQEAARCARCCWICVGCMLLHCVIHEMMIFIDSLLAMAQVFTGRMGTWIRPLDEPFSNAIESIDDSISVLTAFQKALKGELLLVLAGVYDQESRINDININDVNMTSGMARNDVFSGMMASSTPFETSLRQKKIDLTDVVNAARPVWVRDRGLINFQSEAFLLPIFNFPRGPFRSINLLGNRIGGFATQKMLTFNGGSGFYEREPSNILTGILTTLTGQPGSQIQGAHVSSFDGWTFVGNLRYGNCNRVVAGGTPWWGSIIMDANLLGPAIVTSNRNRGNHQSANLIPSFFNEVHSGRHTINQNDSFFDLAVYSTDAEQDNGWLQPGLYAGFSTNSLSRAFDRASGKNPWDLNIKVSLPVEGKINLENSTANPDASEANAVSKAMAYYHHPGNWREPPNFWNPFWRAKLHPYTSNDLIHLIMSGGVQALPLLLTQ